MTTYSPEARALFAILGDNSIRYIPIFAKEFGGVCAAMLLSQLVYWHGKQADENGWIRKTVPELKEETGLTEREQESARAALILVGVIEYKRMGMPAKPHYRVMFDKLISTLSESSPVRTKRPNKKGQNVPTCEDAPSGDLLGQNVLTNSETTQRLQQREDEAENPAAPDKNPKPLTKGVYDGFSLPGSKPNDRLLNRLTTASGEIEVVQTFLELLPLKLSEPTAKTNLSAAREILAGGGTTADVRLAFKESRPRGNDRGFTVTDLHSLKNRVLALAAERRAKAETTAATPNYTPEFN